MALLAQRHRDWDCLRVLPPEKSNVALEWWKCLPGSCLSSAAKVRMSADRWQPGEAILGSCCSASSAHGTVCTEAQRLGLLVCLATSNVKRNFECSCRAPSAALLRKSKCLQIAGCQKGLVGKAVAQPHLPMQLLAQGHRDWGCLLVLPPQISNVSWY